MWLWCPGCDTAAMAARQKNWTLRRENRMLERENAILYKRLATAEAKAAELSDARDCAAKECEEVSKAKDTLETQLCEALATFERTNTELSSAVDAYVGSLHAANAHAAMGAQLASVTPPRRLQRDDDDDVDDASSSTSTVATGEGTSPSYYLARVDMDVRSDGRDASRARTSVTDIPILRTTTRRERELSAEVNALREQLRVKQDQFSRAGDSWEAEVSRLTVALETERERTVSVASTPHLSSSRYAPALGLSAPTSTRGGAQPPESAKSAPPTTAAATTSSTTSAGSSDASCVPNVDSGGEVFCLREDPNLLVAALQKENDACSLRVEQLEGEVDEWRGEATALQECVATAVDTITGLENRLDEVGARDAQLARGGGAEVREALLRLTESLAALETHAEQHIANLTRQLREQQQQLAAHRQRQDSLESLAKSFDSARAVDLFGSGAAERGRQTATAGDDAASSRRHSRGPRPRQT